MHAINIMYTTNHIYMGWLYIIFGLMGGSMGFALSLMLSLELALPGFLMCSSLQYNSCITFHGLFMMSFMMMPMLMGGFGNILIPLMLCTSDMMFPRLNALSLWLVMESLFLMFLSMLLDGGVNAGWTFHVPLSMMNYCSIDLMFFSLHMLGLSSLMGSINFMITMFKACNLSMQYNMLFLSMFSWSMFFTSLLLVMSLPVLAGCMTMIIFDSHFNSSFLDPMSGGDIIFFQHLFWFFGHPEVYILILPAFGLISEMLSKYTLSIMFGSDSMLIALLMMAFLGCMVWGHHMFMVGFDISTKAYFTISTSMMAIPTAIKMLNWLATMWSGSLFFITPLFFMMGFLFSFSFGGFTGLIIASCMIDNLLHDTYFMIGHFHYVLSLGAVYTMFASIYHYMNLLLFQQYNELLGSLHYTFFFISSNLLFLSMHSQGINSFPRSMFDFPMIYTSFHWFNSFGLMGIILSLSFFMMSLLLSNSMFII